ncbi:unnamed protein product [Effrenium voratum]|nr:unnamed protein product [Effrenium voratum]CAJ1435965.1 unnamed protein product [Effrenium voratum]
MRRLWPRVRCSGSCGGCVRGAGSVSVGGVLVPLRHRLEEEPSRVPRGYLQRLPRALRPALKWLAQKDALGQDALLLSSPAERARARMLALAYAELVNSSFEYVGISADTTEADLKQRREIAANSSVAFSDSPPVRAALQGACLVLDGLERAERNVLPTLNNLLENREMSLEDGRFLVDSQRYDALQPALDTRSALTPVHRHFRVLALASPCPPFEGRALDPPLRSRFQALLVPPAPAEELAFALQGLEEAVARPLLGAAETILELERQSIRQNVQFFSFSSTALARRCSRPGGDVNQILRSVYPPLYGSDHPDVPEAPPSVEQALRKLRISGEGPGGLEDGTGELIGSHYRTAEIDAITRAVEADLTHGNVLLLGSRGSGKSAIARALGHGHWPTFALHRDLTGRDLLQRRVTDQETGASSWADQPVASAAREGQVAVLDGAHRLPQGALVAALGRLVERELDLPDGTRLLETVGKEGEGVARLSPNFRLLALAEPGDWLSPELASLFTTHVLPDMTPLEMSFALPTLVPAASPELCQQISSVATAALLTQNDKSFSPGERAALRLSLRVLLRLTRQAASAAADTERLRVLLHEALMSRYLPLRLQETVDGWLEIALGRRRRTKDRVELSAPSVAVDGGTVVSGALRITVRRPSRPELVPSPRHFFASPAAVKALHAILLCEHAGEHAVLLLGNQGVGKNVAVDRVLELLRAEREYVQLHRDTTVSSLTVRPVLENGRLNYEDAPLVRAAKYGRVCVLDEADKAPTEVVVILKALVEDGELLLGDGRRLCRSAKTPSDILIHPDFRLWVLANRPGFPFHGNAFFRECGDAFAAIALDNPDVASETALLHHVAPTYPKRNALDKLALAFGELRTLAENAVISYPYSMREAVAVARHLEKYQQDTVVDALSNVLAFEAYDAPLRRQLTDVFEEHFRGIQRDLEATFGTVSGESGSRSLKSSDVEIRYFPQGAGGASTPRTGLDGPKHGEVDPTGAPHVGGNRWAGGSGGSDTAGLGGRGGPYRLWDGNPVHQVSEEAKAEVTEEAKAQARAMALQAWEQRLAEIEKMDASMWKMYKEVLASVEPQVAQFKAILRQAREKKMERIWLRNRSDGELDDTRLVEGVPGERLVFKKRGQTESKKSDDLQRTKRKICFVMDCSGSMYRFNSLDGRLNRMLEATCLIFESMEGLSDRYEYAVLGHSGESAKIPFVDFGKPPANRGERLKILQKMLAHTQFCWPGDNTIEATNSAIDHVLDAMPLSTAESEPSRAFVVVVSDANFRRYRMDPLWWSEALKRDPRVDGHAVMIGSIGEEASRIRAALPAGHGHVVMDTTLLPSTFRCIFEQAGIVCDDV